MHENLKERKKVEVVGKCFILGVFQFKCPCLRVEWSIKCCLGGRGPHYWTSPFSFIWKFNGPFPLQSVIRHQRLEVSNVQPRLLITVVWLVSTNTHKTLYRI